MTDQIEVQVIDCNLAPVAGATVTMPGSTFQATTDQSGTARLPSGAGQPLQLKVAHPYFVTEEVTFKKDVQTGSWNNSLVSRRIENGDVTLTVQLGRCAAAPTVFLEDGDISNLVKGNNDPKAVLLFKSPNFENTFAYRFQWYAELAVRLARPELLPRSTPGDSQTGWDRFQTDTSSPLQIAESGRFFWLVYPQQPTDRQYVVAVWSPNLPSDTPVSALNMLAFFSPHTASYPKGYPYAVVAGAGGAVPDQPYMTLGKRYLLDEYCFSYEMAAGSNSSVLVMPICNHGDWGPFASASGLYRLLREVAVFLQRECRTSGLGVQQTGYDPSYRLAGASLRAPGAAGIEATDFGVTPAVGKVAVSFFSTGALPAKGAMQSGFGSAGRGFDEQYWGIPSGKNQDPGTAWTSSWVELWDLDGFHPATGGWQPYLDLLNGWYGQNSSRIIRLCHSSGRAPPNPMTATNAIWATLKKQGITFQQNVAAHGSFGSARELHGQRWSVVAFEDSYIENGSKDVPPALGDAHHATASVAFSHCRALTGLGIRQPVSSQRGP